MKSEKEKKFISYWSEERKVNRWQFAFQQGVLRFAWPVYFGSELFKYFMRRNEVNYQFSVDLFLSGFIIWTGLALLAYGLIMWRTYEKRYQNLIEKESQ
ncbi:MAG: hypothetical protein RI909_2205 [Bacteroidota bacterium]|jgi:hypothetical protein